MRGLNKDIRRVVSLIVVSGAIYAVLFLILLAGMLRK